MHRRVDVTYVGSRPLLHPFPSSPSGVVVCQTRRYCLRHLPVLYCCFAEFFYLVAVSPVVAIQSKVSFCSLNRRVSSLLHDAQYQRARVQSFYLQESV